VLKLIINADDFGLSEGVNLGIVKAFSEGVVTSTTALAQGAALDHAVQLSKQFPKLEIGLHLALTIGEPILKNVPTLVDSQGRFFKFAVIREAVKGFDFSELEREWEAQIERFLKKFGQLPSHLDSHHHVHIMGEDGINQVISRLKEKYGIPVRASEQRIRFDDGFYEEAVSVDYFQKFLDQNYQGKIVEVMSHPAFVDGLLRDQSSYCTQREKELEVLTSPALKAFLEKSGIDLITYRQAQGG